MADMEEHMLEDIRGCPKVVCLAQAPLQFSANGYGVYQCESTAQAAEASAVAAGHGCFGAPCCVRGACLQPCMDEAGALARVTAPPELGCGQKQMHMQRISRCSSVVVHDVFCTMTPWDVAGWCVRMRGSPCTRFPGAGAPASAHVRHVHGSRAAPSNLERHSRRSRRPARTPPGTAIYKHCPQASQIQHNNLGPITRIRC